MVVAMQWVSQVTTVAVELVLPALGGYWLDGRWGTAPWLLIAGVIVGAVVSMYHLLQMIGPTRDSGRGKADKPEEKSGSS